MATAELSVVLVNKYGVDRLRRVFQALARQSIADRLEVVVVSAFETPEELQTPFAGIRFVKFSPMESLGAARAAGVQGCTTPFVAFAEDHCFPRPDWAAALLKRLREGWTGVGAAISNHNPSTWVSRADWLLNYGCYSRPGCEGPTRNIPPHNSAYATEVLRTLGADLADLLEMDHHLHSLLVARGGRLFLEPFAQSAHTNISRLQDHWASQFHGSKVYGATRATQHRWPAHRRAIYAAAFPAIAALRLLRACGLLNHWRALPVVPLLTIGAIVAGSGEACGYLFGMGSSLARRVEEELNRPAGVTDSDRPLLL